MKLADFQLWEKFKESVSPSRVNILKQELPPRLKVRYAPVKKLSYVIDLHQKTLDEAYLSTFDFVQRHFKKGSKRIQVITGKGLDGKGLIRAEVMGWLDTAKFRQYIRTSEWTHDKGAVNIWLKKHTSF